MKIVEILQKIIQYLSKNLGGVLGVLQAFLKTISECCMVILRILCPVLKSLF